MANTPPPKRMKIAQADDPAQDAVELPGFGCPLEQSSDLPNVHDWRERPITVRERTMISLMAALKDKHEWDRKIFDAVIVAKWKVEALSFTPDQPSTSDNDDNDPWAQSNENGQSLNIDGEQRQKKIDESLFDYCVAELRDQAKTYQERGFTEAIDANACVYMSDTAVSAGTKSVIRKAAEKLEDVKDVEKDWHPGSDGKVLDLVHPSLFPLLYGRSRILSTGKVPLRDCALYTGTGTILPEASAHEGEYSERFQWLPCEAILDSQGKAKITSYINNLHPAGNEDLYAAIEDIIAASVPMWKETLMSTIYLAEPRIEKHTGYKCWMTKDESRAKYGPAEHMNDSGIGDDDRQSDDEDEDEDEDEDARTEDENDDRSDNFYGTVVPKPKPYSARQRTDDERWTSGIAERPAIEDEKAELHRIFTNQGLQVIVKLANIHLTPEKPAYNGGSWHIEGQLNEHIVASALYYYDSNNVTPSCLAFRERVDDEEFGYDYEQGRYHSLMEIYGIKENPGPAIQQLGMINTREDRLLVFPNVLQHRVAPFGLQDPSKPGHRKLLALFLVDPFIRIPSTANVPPQQKHWWANAMAEKGSLPATLPAEITEQIVDGVEDFPITLEEAKALREELIEERKVFVDSTMDSLKEGGYNFCEH